MSRLARVRTVFLGTSGFAADVLELLAATPHRPVLAVTRPDRPRGRGRRLTPPPVAEAARAIGIEVFQPEDVNGEEARGRIADAEPEVVAVCAFGALLKEPLLSEQELLNVHPSLLPRWRGAAPIERAIEAGDEATGVTIMRPTAEFDAGPVCLQRAEPIRPDDTYGSLSERLETLGGELLVEALDTGPAFRDQPAEGVTYAEKIAPEERRWTRLCRRPSSRGACGRSTRTSARTWSCPRASGWGCWPPRCWWATIQHPESSPKRMGGCCSGGLPARSSCRRSAPRGGRSMDAASWLRGHGALLAGG